METSARKRELARLAHKELQREQSDVLAIPVSKSKNVGLLTLQFFSSKPQQFPLSTLGDDS
jgi:hypothetical protein